MLKKINEINTLSLSLFNVVLSSEEKLEPFAIESKGVIINEYAAYAKNTIIKHLENLTLSGQDLNKTFYSTWKQVQHFISFIELYKNTNIKEFLYKSKDNNIVLPEINFNDLEIFVIKGVSKDTLINKCLDLMISGIAIKEDTLKDLFSILQLLDYKFSGKEGIKNKEANIYLAEKFSLFSEDAEEFLRYLVYYCIDSTSLIKNQATLIKITESNKDVSSKLGLYDLDKLAAIFNRFKPIFLSFKAANSKNTYLVNKISKMSKKLHKPMVENPINLVTQKLLTNKDTHWLKNATLFSLFKALKACHSRIQGQNSFVYRIRNGKSWAIEKDNIKVSVCETNYKFMLKFLKENFNFNNKTVLLPLNIHYSLPTSEKMFVGNIPTGTKFYGKSLATGVYWENNWGANDIDLSGINIDGKIGWNTKASQSKNDLHYSGDITDATDGAIEYLLSDSKSNLPATLVMSNIFTGDKNAGYKIVIAEGDNVNKKLMLNPNKVITEIKTESASKNTILGLFLQEDEVKSFTLLNFSGDSSHIAYDNDKTTLFTQALFQEWHKPLMLSDILLELGFSIIYEVEDNKKPDFDLNIKSLNKSTFIDLFKH